MLTFEGNRSGERFCDGHTRRDFLRIGGLAMGGLTLSELFAAEARAGTRSSHKAVIMVYLPGGPPHIDLVDLKPEAPAEIRGPYKPIETSVSGIRISENLPRIAGSMQRYALVRSIVGLRDEHASNQCLTGWSIGENREKRQPCIGAVASKLFGSTRAAMPPFVELMPRTQHMPYSNPGDPGFLGMAHGSARPTGEVMQDMALKDVTLPRLAGRQRLLASIDGYRRLVDRSALVADADASTQRAFELLTSDKLVKAMDVSQEPAALRDRYGKGSSAPITDAGPDWNEQFLQARRLVEAGARVVTLGFGGWDYHGFWDPKPGAQGERLDQALSALVDDLYDRGMDKDVAVVAWGDFGRTPRMNKDGGRDHWSPVSFCLMAGGGWRTGQVIGSTDRFAEYADDRPVHFREVHATLYHHLGIDCSQPVLRDSEDRPRYVLDEHSPISELV